MAPWSSELIHKRFPSGISPAGLVTGAVSIQQGQVLGQIRRVHRSRPDATPAQILHALENLYLATVTAMGGSVGAVAALPAVGTGVALAMSGGEVVGFLEATAVYTLAVAEIYGVPVYDIERRRTVLMAVLLGESATKLVEKAAGKTGPHWGKQIVTAIPRAKILKINKVLGRNFVTKWGSKQGIIVLGRVVPFGIGAIIGGAANAAIGKGVITSVRLAYGPAPDAFSLTVLDFETQSDAGNDGPDSALPGN
jgi:hypothetical protein